MCTSLILFYRVPAFYRGILFLRSLLSLGFYMLSVRLYLSCFYIQPVLLGPWDMDLCTITFRSDKSTYKNVERTNCNPQRARETRKAADTRWNQKMKWLPCKKCCQTGHRNIATGNPRGVGRAGHRALLPENRPVGRLHHNAWGSVLIGLPEAVMMIMDSWTFNS